MQVQGVTSNQQHTRHEQLHWPWATHHMHGAYMQGIADGEGTPMQDTITGFLLAGVGNVDMRKKKNFLIVDSSEPLGMQSAQRSQSLVRAVC